MSMSKVITIFDCNYICQTVKMTVAKRMLAHKGAKTDVLYGFLRRILPICEKLKTDIPVFVWDMRDSIREEIYPNYKASRRNRVLTHEEELVNNLAYEQFDNLREKILPRLGFKNNFWLDGYEADDLIAAITLTTRPKDKAYVVTRDNDMLQLLRHNVIMYDPQNKKMITQTYFQNKYRIKPQQWSTAKAIAGCSTDEVIGVKGVGDKTAIQYLRGELKKDSKKYRDIENSLDMIQGNLLLVKLPLFGCPLPEINFKRNFLDKEFHQVCTAYGMRSLTAPKFVERWKKAFGKEQ